MRLFVASWFFPPSTSSEGIVTYKLFRNSKHSYDVCSSSSSLWSYKHTLPMDAENIRSFPVETDDFETWISESVALFEKLHAENPYDAIMTRSMPPESIEVARRIRESHPEVPWIASLADPIAKSPYDIKGLILENEEISDDDKKHFQIGLKIGHEGWKASVHENIRIMCAQKDLEDYVINTAEALIFPHDTLKSYVLGARRRANALTVPHSFDRSLYPEVGGQPENGKVTLSFIGHSDSVRSLRPFVEAMNLLRKSDSEAFNKLHLRFIGNTPEDVRALVFNFYLYDAISIEPSVDYLTSLEVMQTSDWLMHVDAEFSFMDEPGGSIFFAGKLADYMGTDKPIFSITGAHTPADVITRRAGGISVRQNNVGDIAEALADIALGRVKPAIDRAYRDTFSADYVAERYDREIERILDKSPKKHVRETWPVVANEDASAQKLLTVCVPSYKVESYLDRCLYSLITSPAANMLEVIVVNDGSPDSSREIGLAYQEHYPHIVKLIDKENGGHGSTINAALARATGTYFRVLDGDDWVDGGNLSELLNNIVEKDAYADLISTNYHQVYIEDGHTVPWMKKSGMDNYHLYDFATTDFTMEYFTIHSMMVKTEVLKAAHFDIQENTFYVDVEYILYPIPYVKTVMFTPEYVYRYAVGNPEQSINPDVFTRRYDHHDRVIRRMLKYYEDMRPQMNEGQEKYMRFLFDHYLLKSHYTLSLVWDKDRERGCARAKDFDSFLGEVDKKMYDDAGVRYSGLRKAREKNFNPAEFPQLSTFEDDHVGSGLMGVARSAARTLSKSSLGNRLVHSRVSRSIARRLS